MLVSVLFYLFEAATVVAGLGVISSRNPVHAALWLVLCFVSSAAIWLLIEAEFLAIVLVLVYVGAVMVLFLFVVMMIDVNAEELRAGYTRFLWLGLLVAGLVIAELVSAYYARDFGLDVARGAVPVPSEHSNTRELGVAVFTVYAYPLQLAAMLLLVAIIAAISLTMRRRQGLKVQDISAQVAVRAADRVRIVKMDAERGP